MATLADLVSKVRRLIADENSALYSDALITDGLLTAIDAILPWMPKQLTQALVGDGVAVSFALPSNCYRIVAVLDSSSGAFIPALRMNAYGSPGDNLMTNQDWCEYPEGYVTFANTIQVDESMTVYYSAVWPKPSIGSDVISVPSYAHPALAYYAASYTLLNKATSGASLNQWDQAGVDSGTPVMNPMKDMSSYFLERFRIEMDRLPHRIRGAHG
jgi:hypothetical protein